MSLRVVFMGSPEFAVPTLVELNSNFTVSGVVTQPDKPKGRGRRITPTAVKAEATRMGLEIAEPENLSLPEPVGIIRRWKPDVIVVVAYGKILPQEVLDLPPMKCVNLHASLLPRHRGASPISEAILVGDDITGVSTILMDSGMDTGAILLQQAVPILPGDTAGSLHDRLLEPGARLVVETLRGMMSGTVKPVAQDPSKATYTRRLSKEDGRLNWNLDAEYLSRLVRAVSPWPGAFFKLAGETVKVREASAMNGNAVPGAVADIGPDGIVVGTSQGLLLLRKLQASGKNAVAAQEFARHRDLRRGDVLQ